MVRCEQTLEHGGYYWSVREFSGTTLLDIVVRDGPVANNKAKAWFRSLVTTVHFLHTNGYCHLNLNPENVFLFEQKGDKENKSDEEKKSSPSAQWKLAGFSQTVELPNNNTVFKGITAGKPGKLQYMAPEIFEGTPFQGKQADAYSLGVILFEMLTGHPAYEQPSCGDKRFKLLYQGQLKSLIFHWGHSDRLDKNAVDLLSLLMCTPDKRLTLDQVLAHPWLTSNEKENKG